MIRAWDTAQPVTAVAAVPAAPAAQRVGRVSTFLLGLVVGIVCAAAWYRVPVSDSGIDYNGDGVLDEKWSVTATGVPVSGTVDRNFDGKPDTVSHFGRDRTITRSESDDDFDGTFESKAYYKQGSPYLIETDIDNDGIIDLKTHLAFGVMVSREFINPFTGLPRKIDYYRESQLMYADVDTNLDGKMDKRITYDAQEMVQSEAAITQP